MPLTAIVIAPPGAAPAAGTRRLPIAIRFAGRDLERPRYSIYNYGGIDERLSPDPVLVLGDTQPLELELEIAEAGFSFVESAEHPGELDVTVESAPGGVPLPLTGNHLEDPQHGRLTWQDSGNLSWAPWVLGILVSDGAREARLSLVLVYRRPVERQRLLEEAARRFWVVLAERGGTAAPVGGGPEIPESAMPVRSRVSPVPGGMQGGRVLYSLFDYRDIPPTVVLEPAFGIEGSQLLSFQFEAEQGYLFAGDGEGRPLLFWRDPASGELTPEPKELLRHSQLLQGGRVCLVNLQQAKPDVTRQAVSAFFACMVPEGVDSPRQADLIPADPVVAHPPPQDPGKC